jgi:hypothetical protein
VTGAPFGEVDLDLLADYAAGVLDEAESRRVGELVESDPQWARAHRALLAADAAVAAQLRAVAKVDLAIPDDVAARLDAAMARADRGTGATVVPLSGRERGDRAGRAGGGADRRVVTWPRLAVAAAVVGVLILGLPVLGGLMTQMDGGTTTASDSGGPASNRESGQQAAPAEPMAALDNAAGAAVTFSGADYNASSLKALNRSLAAALPDLSDNDTKAVPAPSQRSMESYAVDSPPQPAGGASTPVPTELARLLDPVALHACVAAVEAATPGHVARVDFARYDGRPALVVTVNTTPTAARKDLPGVTAVVVGPACGVVGPDRIAGTDQD